MTKKHITMKKIIVLAILLISITASAQTDVMKFLVAKQVEQVSINHINSIPAKHTEEIANQLLDAYNNIGTRASIDKVLDERLKEGTTFNVGLDVFIKDNQADLIAAINEQEQAVYRQYDDIRKASISVKQADDGMYIVLIASHL